MGKGKITDDIRDKIYVNGVNVAILNETVQYLGNNGKLIFISLEEYIRKKVFEQYESLDDFLNKWDEADKKQVVIDELTKHGILFENLKEDINKEMDVFDLICLSLLISRHSRGLKEPIMLKSGTISPNTANGAQGIRSPAG